MGDYCTTQDVLDLDPSSSNLSTVLNAPPDFSKIISFVTKEINLSLKSQFPHLIQSDLADLTELQLPAIHLVLHYLYSSASIRKGSDAIERAKQHKETYHQLMQSIHVNLKNGETFYCKTKIVRG